MTVAEPTFMTQQIHPELTERLRLCRWPGRQFGYAGILQQVDRTIPTHAPQMSVVVDVRQPDTQTLVGLTLLTEQTACPVQLILVDNASDSPLTPLLLEKAHVRIRLRREVSAHVARNLGAMFADTPWLIFLSDNVRPAPDLPAQFLHCLTTQNALAARGDIVGVQDVKGPVFNLLSRNMPPHIWAVDLEENMAVHADTFFQLGGFDEVLELSGALDFSIRLYARHPVQSAQYYCPTATATAGESFDLTVFWLRRHESWKAANSQYSRALLGYCVFWLETLIGKEVRA